ncbi:Etoposide-induced protein 2.4 (EI24) [Epsilonproteobacteria bacterium SCGC AD-308-E02]|nr:Etoposide-induced protein 2.4 (EI24) [Epsilonproteobacteria bacterium SCGC AD-308-E02]
MKSETDLLAISIQDFFSAKMLKYSLMPFIVTMVILYIAFFSIAGIGLDQLGSMDLQSTNTTIENGIPHTETINAQLEGNAIIKFLMGYAVTSWMVSILVYAIGGFLVLYLSIFMALLVLGFLTPYVLKEIHLRHYQDVEMIGHSNLIAGIFLMVKWAFIMIVLFFVFIPLYFIPLVNIVALNFPLYYFFHKAITYDISSSICTSEEDKKIRFFSANKIRLKTLGLYLVSLIPFAIFFGAIFYVIYLGHTYFIEVRKIRNDVA